MSTKRIRAWGLVSLLALAGGCEIDQPPALREALAQRVASEPRRSVSDARPVEPVPAPAATPAIPATSAPGASLVSGAAAFPASDVASPASAGAAPAAGTGPSGSGAGFAVASTRDAHAPTAALTAASTLDARSAGAAPTRPAGDADGPAADTDGPGADAAPTPGSAWRPPSERFPRPQAIRGLYVNAWAAGSSARMEELLGIARRTEVNALVIDIKDATGYVSHRTQVPLAHAIGATGEIRIRDLPGLLDRLEREGIYPIARIVLVKDPLLAGSRPELAVNDTAGGVWVDSKGFTWMNPYARDLWEYHVALAREVALLGFPEIQYDYVRFPDAPQDDLARAVYLGADDRSKPAVIGDLLRHARAELADLDVRLTADVFGVTTSARRDVGIGQVWESFIDAVDVALPMVYPSHYWQGSFGFGAPNAHPYEIVVRALRDALGRSAQIEGAGLTRPWLQDFSLGEPAYTSAEVRAQIQATYDAGIDEWILWNPGSRYTELALQPVAGFDREPYIRLANRLVPVSERWAVLDSVAEARVRADSVRADSVRAAARASEATAPPAIPASVPPPAPVGRALDGGTSAADTVGATRD